MHARGIAVGLITLSIAAAARAQPDPQPPPDTTTGTEPEPEPEPEPVTAPAAVTEPEPEPAPSSSPRKFTIEPFGYLRVVGGVTQNDPNVAFVGRDDGFELQNIRFGVEGTIDHAVVDVIYPRIAYRVSLDGAVDERSRINDPNGKLKVGLRDAYADVYFAGFNAIRAGRFDIWFDPEHLYEDTERPFIERSLESRGTLATQGYQTPGLPPGRSIGVAYREQGPGSVEVAVQNGADEFSSDNDNDLPAVSATVRLASSLTRVLQIGFRWNPRTEGDLPLRHDETDLEGAFGGRFDLGPVDVAAGFIYVHTSFDTTDGPSQNAYGGHGQVMVNVIRAEDHPLAVGYRFAILDPSDLILTDRVMEHTAGAVLAVPAWHLRAQLDVTHVMEQADRDLSNDRVQAALEVSL